MYWIKRVYLDGVGFAEAFFRDQTIELIPQGWSVSPEFVPHTYMDLINGGGKTTWVSLILTMFEPHKSKFVQVIAGRKKRKDYNFNDYFHPHLSTLLVEMVDDNGHCIVLGQYHQKQKGDTQSVYFMCDAPNQMDKQVFESIPSYGRAKYNVEFEQYTDRLKDAKHWITQKISQERAYWRISHSRNEWQEGLSEVGINLEMIASLITINSEEGGVSHFSNFKNEQDFLEKFYACCIPSVEIDSLQSSCANQVEQGGQLKKLQQDKTFYLQLQDVWFKFLPYAKEANQLNMEVELAKMNLATHLRDVLGHKTFVSQEIDKIELDIKSLNVAIAEYDEDLSELGDRSKALNYQICQYDLQQAESNQSQLSRELEREKGERSALEAVREYQRYKAEEERYKQQMELVNALLSKYQKPLVERLELAKKHAKKVFMEEIESIDFRLNQIEDKTIELQKEKELYTDQLADLKANQQNYPNEQTNCKYNIKRAITALKQLRKEAIIQVNESPELSAIRLTDDGTKLNKEKEVAKRNYDDACLQQNYAEKAKSQANEKNVKAITRFAVASTNMQTAKDEKEKIEQQLVEHSISLDPNAEQKVLLRLKELLEFVQQSYNQKSEHCQSLREQFNRLRQKGHLLIDEEVREALDVLYELGFTKEQVRAFPEYIDKTMGDAEKVAEIVDSDPGRYLGIAASDSNILEKIANCISSIDWQNKPIPIYQIREDELETNPQPETIVLSTSDKFLYSENAWQEKLKTAESNLETASEELSKVGEKLSQLSSLKSMYKEYLRRFGRRYESIEVEYQEAEKNKTEADEQLTLASEEFDLAKKEVKNADQLVKQTETQCQLNENNLKEIARFLRDDWQKKQESESRLLELDKLIGQNEIALQEVYDRLKLIGEKERQAFEQQGDLGRLKVTREKELSNSSFSITSPSDEAPEGMSPELAVETVLDAEKALKSFQQESDIELENKKLEQNRQDCKELNSKLNLRPGWHNKPERVKALALLDEIEFEQCITAQPAKVEQIKDKLTQCIGDVERLKTSFLKAKSERPIDIEVTGDYTLWKLESIELIGKISVLNDELANGRDRLKYKEQSHSNYVTRLNICDNLLTLIMACVSEPEPGVAREIIDLTSLSQKVHKDLQEYTGKIEKRDNSELFAKRQWELLREVLRKEGELSVEEQRESLMFKKWQGVEYNDALNTIDEKSLIIKDCVAGIESQIAKVAAQMKLTIDELVAHLEKAISLLQSLSKVKIPNNSPIHPGKVVFKLTGRISDLSDRSLSDICEDCLIRWTTTQQVPGTNGSNDKLTAYLLQQLLAEGELQIRMIKTSRTPKAKYFNVATPVGSDGQLLSSAFLLYMAVAKVRELETGVPSYGFMIADNPIGECNADDLVTMQLEMAKAVGIQLIYLTGHRDYNLQAKFDLIIYMGIVAQLREGFSIGQIDSDVGNQGIWDARLQTTSTLRTIKDVGESTFDI